MVGSQKSASACVHCPALLPRGPRANSCTRAKGASKRADDGLPLHSFRTLLQDLATLAYNITHTSLNPEAKIVITTRPTPLQDKAFKLLDINPSRTQ